MSIQFNSKSLRNLKDGIFNYYPKNSSEHFVTKRNGDFQIETSKKTGDTLLLKINWINDSSYTLKFISGSGKTAIQIPKSLKKHILAYRVVNVNKDYYVFKGYKDKIARWAIQTDTMWLKEKTPEPKNGVFALSKLQKKRF